MYIPWCFFQLLLSGTSHSVLVADESQPGLWHCSYIYSILYYYLHNIVDEMNPLGIEIDYIIVYYIILYYIIYTIPCGWQWKGRGQPQRQAQYIDPFVWKSPLSSSPPHPFYSVVNLSNFPVVLLGSFKSNIYKK